MSVQTSITWTPLVPTLEPGASWDELSEQVRDRRAVVHDSDGAALGVGEAQFVVDAEGVVDGGGEVLGAVGRGDGVGGVFVGLAVDAAAADAGSGEQGGEQHAPVVAASGAVELRGATHFAKADDERFVEQAPFIEVCQEGRQRLIEVR